MLTDWSGGLRSNSWGRLRQERVVEMGLVVFTVEAVVCWWDGCSSNGEREREREAVVGVDRGHCQLWVNSEGTKRRDSVDVVGWFGSGGG